MFTDTNLLWLWFIAASSAFGQIPEGWQWRTEWPFGQLTVSASSEEKVRWPAGNAVDGDTSERGMWLTPRNDSKPEPESAWLEIGLDEPRRIYGVGLFHQVEGHYRSIDFQLACRVGGEWKQVASIQDNQQDGWRDHYFDPVETTGIRLTITKSMHGKRMGVAEIRLLYAPAGSDHVVTVVAPPFRCGNVADLGVVTFDASIPDGASIRLRTRTAPDAGETPGEWSDWSEPCTLSGSNVTSPRGDWIQYEASLLSAGPNSPVLGAVVIGSPACVDRVEIAAPMIPQADDEIGLRAQFNRPMDRAQPLLAELHLPGAPAQTFPPATWSGDGMEATWHPLRLGPGSGLGRLVIGSAKTRDGLLMMHHEVPMVVGREPILARLVEVGAWITEKGPSSAIFVQGYEGRTLLGLHKITGKQRYLDAARKYTEILLDAQTEAGFWGTGYGSVYLADTGSALGHLVNYYKYASPDERDRIDAAFKRYLEMIETGDGKGGSFAHEDGSFGVGFGSHQGGKGRGIINKPYSISTALTGAEVYAALYYITDEESHKHTAVKACDWLLDTMMEDGRFPYIIDDWFKRDSQDVLFTYRHGASTYIGEGLIQAWTYIDDADLRGKIEDRIKPHIEWVLRDQNLDGSWGEHDHINMNESRSHGIVNLLLWYDRNVKRDPRIAAAVRRYYTLLLDRDRTSYVTFLNERPETSKAWNAKFSVPITEVTTSLAGRALVEIIKPAADCYRWKAD